jgi:hypothetical protein
MNPSRSDEAPEFPRNREGGILGIRDFFTKRAKEEVVGTKVLVATLDRKFMQLVKIDGDCYSRFYPASTMTVFESVEQLLEAIAKGYDILHLFCDVSPEGSITDERGNRAAGIGLIQSCCDSDVKMLWIASENKPEGYMKGFKAATSKPLNLVLTIDRKGSKFGDFLDKLLLKMSAGETIPSAWVSLSPQNSNDPRNQAAPACIFAAGRGAVRLR